jgi:hypothetical protein
MVMTAEPRVPAPRGRTANGRIPDPEAGLRLVQQWAADKDSADEQRETYELIMKAYAEARGLQLEDVCDDAGRL